MLAMSVGEQFLYLLLGRRSLELGKYATEVESQALLSVGLCEPWLSVQLYFRHAVTVIISIKLHLKARTCVKKESVALSCLSLSLCLLICYNRSVAVQSVLGSATALPWRTCQLLKSINKDVWSGGNRHTF